MPCQGCTKPHFCRTGAASAREISASSAEEARQEAARARQRLRDVALIFGPAGAKLPPDLEELDPAEEEAMARRASAHANKGNRRASIKVHALLIVHQLCGPEELLLKLILQYGCCGP